MFGFQPLFCRVVKAGKELDQHDSRTSPDEHAAAAAAAGETGASCAACIDIAIARALEDKIRFLEFRGARWYESRCGEGAVSGLCEV